MSRVGAELRVFSRDGMAMAFIFAFPVVMLLIFGSVFGDEDAGPGGVTFVQYFLAGMVATGVMLSSFQNLALSIADERDQGLLKRLRGTPMPPAAYLLGKIGLVLLVGGVQTALTLLTAVALLRRRPAVRPVALGRPSRGSTCSAPRPARSSGSASRRCRARRRRRTPSSPRW